MSLPGVGEWSVILQKYMKKDNNLLFFFKLFFKRMVYRLEENKEKFTNWKRKRINGVAA